MFNCCLHNIINVYRYNTDCFIIKVHDAEESLKDILTRLSATMDEGVEGFYNKINVDRDDVLDGGLRGFLRPTFMETSRLHIKFAGEDSSGGGGPTKSFLQLCRVALPDLSIFHQTDNGSYLTLDARGKCVCAYKCCVCQLTST